MNRKGMAWSEVAKWILFLVFLVILIVIIFSLARGGDSFFDRISDILRFRGA